MRLSLLSKAEDAHEDAVWSCAWAAPNMLVTGSVDETVKLWSEEGDSLESQHTYTGHTLGVVSVAVDCSGTYAASSALDSFIRVWNLKDNSTKAIIETQPSETWQIAFAVDTSEKLILAAAGGSSNSVRLWNADSSQEEAVLTLPTGEDNFKKERFVLSVACSPDGKRLASGSMDGTVAVFDTASGKLLHTLEGHFKPVRSLAFTPDSKMLITACDDMHSHLYDVENASLIEAFSAERVRDRSRQMSGTVMSAVCPRAASYLAVQRRSAIVVGPEMWQWHAGHESWVLSVAVHPDGHSFVTGSSDSKVKLWDLQSRSCAQTISEHTDQVWDVAFRQDGLRVATVSDDKAVALYDFA